jgi:hypothetical protein
MWSSREEFAARGTPALLPARQEGRMKNNPAVAALLGVCLLFAVFAAPAEVKRNRPAVLFRADEVIE